MIVFNSFVAGMCFAGAIYEVIHYKFKRKVQLIEMVAFCLVNLWCAITVYMG